MTARNRRAICRSPFVMEPDPSGGRSLLSCGNQGMSRMLADVPSVEAGRKETDRGLIGSPQVRDTQAAPDALTVASPAMVQDEVLAAIGLRYQTNYSCGAIINTGMSYNGSTCGFGPQDASSTLAIPTNK